ncbi:pentapeptide repeat-containing protein [Nocardia harenae]|uniref:pentapeptide repeat-containing protein n=1 Tax=Nocardia harenae TaxID=358707 RepID=UPI00083524B1|nr:pentapeptide repeat-containing protein [Nocardia harenae]
MGERFRGITIAEVAGLVTALTAIGAVLFTARSFEASRLQVETQRETQINDRYYKAVSQLGSENLDIRLGAIYSLERLAVDSPRDHWGVFSVLSAFVRTHAPAGEACDSVEAVAPDIEAASTAIARRGYEEDGEARTRGEEIHAVDVGETCLAGVLMVDVTLTNTDFRGSDLSGAVINSSGIFDTNFDSADLREMVMRDTAVWRSSFRGADLSGAVFERGELNEVGFQDADLTGASFRAVSLEHVDLSGADLTGVDLTGVGVAGVKYDARTVWPVGFRPPPSR